MQQTEPTIAHAAAKGSSLKAAGIMVFVALLMATDAALVRILTAEADVHPFVIGFFRALFGLLIVLPWLARERRSVFVTRNWGLHVIRAALKLLALISLFFAVAEAPLAAVTAIAFATPLFVTVGAVMLLGESLPPLRIVAIGAGFLGVLVVLRPGFALIDPGLLYALASAIGLAGVALTLKYLTGRDSPATIVGLNFFITVPLALVLAVPVFTPPPPSVLGLLVLQGAIGAMAMILVTRAMSMADASFLTPIEFVRLPLVAVIAYFAFGEVADLATWIGGFMIFVATVLLTRTDRRLAPQSALDGPDRA